mmetsp:Transcript_371/g.1401  ORF Transcript_371/g.1401 Transcript_371/m.1401 type:complete len:402 (+) Transcript_371:4095-5300(+)
MAELALDLGHALHPHDLPVLQQARDDVVRRRLSLRDGAAHGRFDAVRRERARRRLRCARAQRHQVRRRHLALRAVHRAHRSVQRDGRRALCRIRRNLGPRAAQRTRVRRDAHLHRVFANRVRADGVVFVLLRTLRFVRRLRNRRVFHGARLFVRAPLLRGFAALLQPLQPVHHLGVAEAFALDELEEHLDAIRQVAVPAREVLERGDNLQARGFQRVGNVGNVARGLLRAVALPGPPVDDARLARIRKGDLLAAARRARGRGRDGAAVHVRDGILQRGRHVHARARRRRVQFARQARVVLGERPSPLDRPRVTRVALPPQSLRLFALRGALAAEPRRVHLAVPRERLVVPLARPRKAVLHLAHALRHRDVHHVQLARVVDRIRLHLQAHRRARRHRAQRLR